MSLNIFIVKVRIYLAIPGGPQIILATLFLTLGTISFIGYLFTPFQFIMNCALAFIAASAWFNGEGSRIYLASEIEALKKRVH